jgi:GNAT superfamily N-acetyltransferase
MAAEDLDAVVAVAETVHPDLPERPEVLDERRRLYPPGALVVEGEAGLLGYLLCHPGLAGAPPPLDSLLLALPDQPTCLYLHDIALRPEARRLGLAAAALDMLRGQALGLGLGRLALTAVGGSAVVWRRLGFAEAAVAKPLAGYGPGAVYMEASC